MARQQADAAGGGDGAAVVASVAEDPPAAPAVREPLPAGETGDSFITHLPFQVLSWEPRALFFPNFLDEARCKRVIELASRRLAPSGLALRKGDTAAATADVRTSQGTFLTKYDDKEGVLDYIEKRMAAASQIHQSHGEPFNVLRYEVGQKYDSHYDTFDPESYGPQSSNRVATFLLYLNEWDEGGETVFLLEGKNGLERLRNIDYKACDTGLAVKPARTGDALLFWSIQPGGGFDKRALHGGCPVRNGTKWSMTKWIRDKSFGPHK